MGGASGHAGAVMEWGADGLREAIAGWEGGLAGWLAGWGWIERKPARGGGG